VVNIRYYFTACDATAQETVQFGEMGVRYLLLAILAGFQLMLSGCETMAPLPAAAGSSGSLTASYRLGVGDKFRLNVFSEPTLSGEEFSVNSDGEASLPLIGPVRVLGMTAGEAEAAVTQRYAAGFVNNPRLNIDITGFRPFYILGEVNKPGEYPFAADMTVLNAVARAGGFTFRADQRRLFVRHSGEGGEVELPLAANTPVLPGDTVRILERVF
jgi:protein involved in polysaccharide export with SLBB domain